ncbi:DUF3467 domain-containing protein [Candidatus Roizmanbacteria bacterium]|nr:DUF3467 domain-containing protein [Candidatus Roizmanbacteria bacterium]
MDKQEIKVNPNSVIGTSYSQLASVTVTDVDVTLEFVYINPRNQLEGAVVSRVTLPKSVASDLANTIKLTLENHDSKTKN